MGMHKTKRKLIDTVIELMNGNPSADVTIHQVLEASNITSGSLYYHFSDFEDLIDHALVDMYGQFAEDVSTRLRSALGVSDSAAEMNDNLSPTIDARHMPNLAAMRSARTWIAAQATLRPSLGAKLAPEQQRVTQEIADIVAEAQEKGIAQKVLDPYVVAVFIQSYALGRIVDDLAGGQMDGESWTKFIKHMVATSLLDIKKQ